MNPLLWGTDVFVTEVSGVYEPTKTILQPHPYTDALARTAAIVEVLPDLHVHVHPFERGNTTSACLHIHTKMYSIY